MTALYVGGGSKLFMLFVRNDLSATGSYRTR
jgi:hypothetical protein